MPAHTEDDSNSSKHYRVCLSGKYGVGKSTLFRKVAGASSTCGIAEYTYRVPNFSSEIRLIDTAGVERHSSLTLGNHYRGCSCIVFVYDVTDMETLHYITKEFESIQQRGHCDTNIKLAVLRNKIDQVEQVSKEMEISHLDSNEELKSRICCIAETSGETGSGVDDFFRRKLMHLLEDLCPVGSPRLLPAEDREENCCV